MNAVSRVLLAEEHQRRVVGVMAAMVLVRRGRTDKRVESLRDELASLDELRAKYDLPELAGLRVERVREMARRLLEQPEGEAAP